MDLAVEAAVPARTRLDALDGLRGLALVGMLLWHAQVSWIDGGFARMTIFFVLSGYLATRSALRRPEGRFRDVWRRRTLRLLPLTLVGTAVAIGVTVLVGSVATKASMRGDAISVLTYTANWRFLVQDQGYGALFERQSAFQHFWSLSIEEQCFLLLPLLLAGAAWFARRGVGRSWSILALAAALAAIPALIDHSADAAYFGTHTRLAEFLVGVWLALVLAPDRLRSRRGAVLATRTAGRLSLVALVVVMLTIGRDEAWLYSGGMAIFAIPAAAVIAAAVVGDPLLERTLGALPLRTLGRWALSVYVLHWPLYLLLADRWPSSVDVRWLVPVQLAVAVVAGGVAHHLVERPLLPADSVVPGRRRTVGVRLPVLFAGSLTLAVTAVALPSSASSYDFEDAEDRFASAAPVGSGRDVAVFGGSTAVQLGLGLGEWVREVDGFRSVTGEARLGCGLFEQGERSGRNELGALSFEPVPDECRGWPARWAETVDARDIEIAVVFMGVWELADWRSPDGSTMSLGDPVMDERVRAALATAVTSLRQGGAERIVLATTAEVGAGIDGNAPEVRGLPADHRERTARFNTLLRDATADQPDVAVLEYAAVVSALPEADRNTLIPDGVHPTWEGAQTLWLGALGEALVEALG